jgi:hypothetical protein
VPQRSFPATSFILLRACVLAAVAPLLILAATVRGQPAISSASGYVITWDGDNGVNPTPPNVPTNVALAIRGAVAYASGQLGPQIGLAYHRITNINDGVYGNSRSWIGGDGDPAPWFAGIQLPASTLINGLAWGRDNSGAFQDRCLGTYTLQFSTNGSFTTNASAWTTLGTVSLGSSTPGFNPWLRHRFALARTNGAPISATALRVVVPSTGFAGVGVAIDELELFAAPTPPSVTLAPATTGHAVLSWSPATAGFVLQENFDLSTTNWVNSPSGATNPVSVSTLGPGKFYRVFKQ